MKFNLSLLRVITLASLFCTAEAALAASGAGQNVVSIFEEIVDIMKQVSIPLATAAGFWVGYKIIWGGKTILEMGPFIVGIIILGSSPWIVSTFLN